MSEAKPEETTIDDKPEEKVEDEEQGGLDEDDDILTLKSGGQNPKSFEIPKTSASLSKFVTTILEGTLCFAFTDYSQCIDNKHTHDNILWIYGVKCINLDAMCCENARYFA